MSVYIGPFARIVNVHWSAQQERWVLLEGAGAFEGTHYEGEGDQVNANSALHDTTGYIVLGTFTSEMAAEEAWAPYNGDTDPGPNWHMMRRWTMSSASPAPPEDYFDPAWEQVHVLDGYLPVGSLSGRHTDSTPDPNCPPEEYIGNGVRWTTVDHAFNWLDWQRTLGPQRSSFSVTIQPYGGTEFIDSCTPGEP